ncbi:MAG: hypothetical protein M1358_08535 [Chloroflexi bacterium]|nr:hypothetical protein [Chloroflexota bacterium]
METFGKLLYFGLVGFLALIVLSFFTFLANASQSPAAIAVGWLVVVLSVQVTKAARR